MSSKHRSTSRMSNRTMQRLNSLPEDFDPILETVPTYVEDIEGVRLRDPHTNEIILIPVPSNDPNDPLNWSQAYKYYVAGLVCFGMFFCNFLAAGPTVAIVDIAKDFPSTTSSESISKVSYFFTTSALLQGVGNLFWMPLILKFGRRPIYTASFFLYTLTALWSGVSTSYTSELIGRMVMGFAAGSGECLGPLTISDIFFLHERGTMMAMYTAALSSGVSGGIILSGLITIRLNWRYIYYITVAILGFLTLLIYFTLPETSYERITAGIATSESIRMESMNKSGVSTHIEYDEPPNGERLRKKTFAENLRLYNGIFSKEPVTKLIFRPIGLIFLPPVLWATLVMAVTIGFNVAISSNFATAFSTYYNFAAYQSGLCFISGLVGAAIGIAMGGKLSDAVADFFTRRNRGLREPEMRLPAMAISLIAAPASLLLYGIGIDDRLHWMVPTLGLGLLNFALVQATNISLTYTIDCYHQFAGEVVVTQLAFKSMFGFLLSFLTNPWIDAAGYKLAFSEMASISGGVLLLFIPFYFFGRQIRNSSADSAILGMIS